MASFNSRWGEIEKAFDDAYKKATEAQEPEDVLYSRYALMKGQLKTYSDSRVKTMENLLKLLKTYGNSITEKGQTEAWKKAANDAGQASFKAISDMDDNEESLLNVVVLAIACQEADFFAKLAAMQHGAIQGFMCQNAAKLYEERKRLGDKWKAIEGSAKSINQKSEAEGKKILQAFEQAVDEIGKANRRAADMVRDTALAYKKFKDGEGGAEPGFPDILEDGEARVATLVHTAKEVSDMYRNAYKSKETTLVLFGNNREAVRKFLDETNLENSLKRSSEAQKEATSLAGTCMTKAQQDDMKAFVYEANKMIQGAVQFYEKGFNDFIKEFKGIFIGPIGTNTLDQLLKGTFWKATEDKLERINFESELKKYYDEAEDMWDIPLSGVDDTLQRAFKDAFKRELRDYDDAIEEAILTYRKVAKIMFYDYPVYRLKEMVERFKGWDD